MAGLQRLSADVDNGDQVSINIWVFAVLIAIVPIIDRVSAWSKVCKAGGPRKWLQRRIGKKATGT